MTPSFAASAARAFVAVAVVALVADALLGALTGALAVNGGPVAPWWDAGHVLERTRWVVFAAVLAASARALAATGSTVETRAGDAWHVVGVAAMLLPLLWLVASWIVQAAILTAAGRWGIDGQAFLAASYYRGVVADYAPWLLGGAAAVAAERHVER